MLELNDVNVVFNEGTKLEKTALDHVSVHIKEGEFVTILGSNGAGKSTFFNVVTGSVPVTSGTATLKDAVNEAMREWTRRLDDTHYCLGSVMGPHPFPTMVRDFQAVISRESKAQMLETEGRLPDMVVACVGGGSNAIGLFAGFLDDSDVRLVGVEPAGRGLSYGDHAASLCCGEPALSWECCLL